MYPICVRFKPTIAPIPETKEITTNTTEMSRTSTEQETNTEAGSTSIEILSTSNTPSVPHTSQDELVTYIKCGESRSNDDDANEADTMIYNDTTDGSIMAATNVSTSGITDITITNNGTLETETTTEWIFDVQWRIQGWGFPLVGTPPPLFWTINAFEWDHF